MCVEMHSQIGYLEFRHCHEAQLHLHSGKEETLGIDGPVAPIAIPCSRRRLDITKRLDCSITHQPYQASSVEVLP